MLKLWRDMGHRWVRRRWNSVRGVKKTRLKDAASPVVPGIVMGVQVEVATSIDEDVRGVIADGTPVADVDVLMSDAGGVDAVGPGRDSVMETEAPLNPVDDMRAAGPGETLADGNNDEVVSREGVNDAGTDGNSAASVAEDGDDIVPQEVPSAVNNCHVVSADRENAVGPARREQSVVRIKLREAKRRPPPPIIDEDEEETRLEKFREKQACALVRRVNADCFERMTDASKHSVKLWALEHFREFKEGEDMMEVRLWAEAKPCERCAPIGIGECEQLVLLKLWRTMDWLRVRRMTHRYEDIEDI